jgi:SET domain-containing protein
MLTVSSYVAPSAIEGLGVFAGEFVPGGNLLWSFNSRFDIPIYEAEIEGFPPHLQDFIARYGYPHMEIPGVLIVDSDNGRFMNHSLTPNTDFRIFDKGYALVDIAQGDELTCNYHEFDPSFVGYFPTVQVAAVDAARLHASGR